MIIPFAALRLRSLARGQVAALRRGDIETFAVLFEERMAVQRAEWRGRAVPGSVRRLDTTAEKLLGRELAAAKAAVATLRSTAGSRNVEPAP